MKKLALIAIIASMSMSLAACGSSDDSSDTSSETTTEAAAETTTEIETETVAETEPDTEAETTVEETEAATTVTAEAVDFTPVEGLSDNYADLENRSFAYDGTIYTLGECTLKDLIDGGIPFNESDLNNKGNNLNANYETSSYTATINDFVSMQFRFINNTDSSKTEEECLLSYVRWYTIYVPQPDYDESLNEEITANINDAASHVCFSFPLTLTKEQLLENNPNTTEEDEYNNVDYLIDSEVYMGSSGYQFEFNDATNQMEQVSIDWLP